METIPADVIRKAALELSPRDVISLCLSKKGFNKIICNSDIFWRNKIAIDYPRQTIFKDLYLKNPKRLYMLLSMNSKIVEMEEEDFPALLKIDTTELSIEIADLITKYITPQFIRENNLKRGDVLHLEWEITYRNEGKYLWDGEKVVLLDYEDDDYGSVPKEFAFPEFRPDYFSESIAHNNIVRLTSEKVQEMINNFDVETQTSYITDKYDKYIVKLSYDISGLDIKFDKIFPTDYLDYDVNNKVLIFQVPYITSGGMSSGKSFTSKIRFHPEWKEAIISINPVNELTTYKWEGNTLEIKGKY